MDFPRTIDEITPEWLTQVLRERVEGVGPPFLVGVTRDPFGNTLVHEGSPFAPS